MLPKRVIARIDIKGPDVIKSVRFEGVRKVGKPEELAVRYMDAGADEIILIDAVSSLYRRPPSFEVMKEILKNVWIPVTLGGGLTSLSDMERAFQAGADKVAINTAGVRNPELFREAIKVFGAQSVIASVVAKRVSEHSWHLRTDNAREATGIDAVDWCERLSDMGVGEIVLSSVDHEGMKSGMDRALIAAVARVVTVPLIVYGGIGSSTHVEEIVTIPGVDAVASSTALHYNLVTIAAMKDAISSGAKVHRV